jgi:SPP1 family predicted phage head-tail adaptor
MSSAPAIGDLRLRMTLEAPVDSLDEAGSTTRLYEPLASIWAQLAPSKGDDRFVASRQEDAISHIVRIRWRSDVTSQMRFSLGSRRLLIHSVYDADERRRFLTCHCEEIKP